MGYYTYITGGVEITPPIDENQFKDVIGSDGECYFVLTDQVDGDEDVQIINGQITVVGQTAGHSQVDIAFEESVKAYDFDGQVQTLVETAKKHGHTVNGQFDGDGEESEDFWRVNIVNNKIIAESGSIVFPSDQYTELARLGSAPRAHGNVIPRPDGKRTRCGGVPLCQVCVDEHLHLSKLIYREPS